MYIYNYFHNILRLFDVLQFSFHHKWNDARLLLINMVYTRIWKYQESKKKKTWKTEINTLSANFTRWSNTLKRFVGKLPTNCLSVFDHFVWLTLKGLSFFSSTPFHTTTRVSTKYPVHYCRTLEESIFLICVLQKYGLCERLSEYEQKENVLKM